MNFLNNLLHNDYVWFPLWIGVGWGIGYAWWSESTRVFSSITKTQTNVNTITSNRDSITSGSETIRGEIASDTSTIVPHDFRKVISDPDRITSFEDRIQAYTQADLERVNSSFIDRIQGSIQADLERVNSSFNQNINSIKVSEETLNVTELYDSGKLDLLSNTAWSSSNAFSHMELSLHNGGNVLTSYPQIVDLISLTP
jgi:hypothetical protein